MITEMYGTDQNYCLHEDYFEKIIVCQNYLINVIICVSIKDKIDEKSQYFSFNLFFPVAVYLQVD